MVRTRYATALFVLLLAGLVATPASAQGPAPGSCTLGTAEADLDINNIFGRVFNTGSLFFGNTTTNGDGYLAPKASLNSPIFASGIWVGGRVNGTLRVAGSRYSGFTFWPGPLGSDGRPVNPASCAAYDRIYSVSRANIADYEAGIETAEDLAEWPVDLGAPVVDGDGVPDNYNLEGGDRPDIIGDQGVFWVMNDVGGPHTTQGTNPLGIEVQVLAFSFSRADALGNTTFYRYRVINKGGLPIEDTYISVFSDPDLGDSADDYVGYDDDLGLGFVYNAADTDATYGVPPAVGYDFFQGPIVGGDTLAATAFSYFENVGAGQPTADPSTGVAIYNYMQGLWGDGTPMRASGNGYGAQGGAPITKFAFPGDPVTQEFWSEVNNDGNGTDNGTGDRRFAVHTGPFTLNPNEPQDIVFGIVFAQGADRFNSITALRAADRLAQTAYDNDFQLAPPPPAPSLCQEGSTTLAPGSGNCLEAVTLNQEATLVWGYPANSSNYLGRFEAVDVLLDPELVDDNTYNFEGFNIYRYPTANFDESQRQLVATYDVDNGVTTVIDQVFNSDLGDLAPTVVARGTDSGVQYSFRAQNLTNYTDYYYGVSAYSFNAESTPKVIESSPTQITVRPAGLVSGRETRSANGDTLAVTPVVQSGEGRVIARVIDPTQVTGATYEVQFFSPTDATGATVGDVTTYRIVNTTTNQVVVDGQQYYAETGEALPLGEDIRIIDGFSFTVLGPQPGFNAFVTVSNASGPLSPLEEAVAGYGSPAANFPHSFFETAGGDRPTEAQQVGEAEWFIHQGSAPTDPSYETWLSLVARNDNFSRIGAFDYEWRFTAAGGQALNFSTCEAAAVPFELWNTGVSTPDDASDDVRLIPLLLDDFVQEGAPEGAFNLGTTDHAVSGGDNDPYTDRLYWYTPTDMSPGQAGYNAAIAAAGNEECEGVDSELFARMVLVNWNGGSVTAPEAYNQALPEAGTTFRIITTKPNQPGDRFAISTADLQIADPSMESQVAALSNIQIVPNPYLGASNYESGNLSKVARFTNLPEEAATIRIFTVAGTLVKTLRKEGSSRSLDWNLETENNLPIASGMYLIHIDIDGVGERTLKFGVVQRRTEITIF